MDKSKESFRGGKRTQKESAILKPGVQENLSSREIRREKEGEIRGENLLEKCREDLT